MSVNFWLLDCSSPLRLGAKKRQPGEAAFERIRNSLVFGRSKGFADLGFNLIAQLDVVL